MTDFDRWADLKSFRQEWSERSLIVAAMIPSGSRVLDFGAGAMSLAEMLPSNCTYIPVDLVKRRADCIVVDLNGPTIPAWPLADVAVFLGVLEYLEDPSRLLRSVIAAGVEEVLISYAVAGCIRRTQPRDDRRRHGWVNHYTLQNLLRLLRRCGFHGTRDVVGVWKGQPIIHATAQRSKREDRRIAWERLAPDGRALEVL